ncbi:MAG: TlpA family protein disulfide reductase [Planctomycetota bacterium]
MHLRVLIPLLALCALLMPARALADPSEQRWMDRRIPADERAALQSTVGFGLPAIPDDLQRFGDELPDLQGKVVVLQSWTRKTPAGRAAPGRAQLLLNAFDRDDVQLICLHTPEGADRAADFLERKPAVAPTLVDAVGAYCDELGIWKRPVCIVVDRSGVIRYAGLSFSGLPRAVEKLVAEEPGDAEIAPLPPRAERESNDGAAAAAPSGGEFPPITGTVRGANDLRGKKGPQVVAQRWLNGQPDLEDKVVMVEFWATWCGPCIKGIPHLNDLHKEFSDHMTIVGVSAEREDTVRTFMNRMPMRYTVASDPQRRMTSAVGNRGIPHAIVMSPDGIVRWQGHPGTLDAKTVRQIVAASNLGSSAGGSAKRWVKPTGG